MAHYIIGWIILTIDLCILWVKVWFCVFESFLVLVLPRKRRCVLNEIVLITGSSHGIGKQLALKFAELGAKLVLWDINQEGNEAVAQEIRDKGGIAHAYPCDVSNEKQVETTGRKVKQEVGTVNILINNAGILNAIPLLSMNNQQIRRTMEVNALSHLWTIRQFLPDMLHLAHGHIVCVSSQAGLIGFPFLVDYCASKHATVGLMNALEAELDALGKGDMIHLTTICPLGIKTGLLWHVNSRFPSVFPYMEVDYVVGKIVDSILRKQRHLNLPPSFDTLSYILRPLPHKAKALVLKFINYTIEPHIDMSKIK